MEVNSITGEENSQYCTIVESTRFWKNGFLNIWYWTSRSFRCTSRWETKWSFQTDYGAINEDSISAGEGNCWRRLQQRGSTPELKTWESPDQLRRKHKNVEKKLTILPNHLQFCSTSLFYLRKRKTEPTVSPKRRKKPRKKKSLIRRKEDWTPKWLTVPQKLLQIREPGGKLKEFFLLLKMLLKQKLSPYKANKSTKWSIHELGDWEYRRKMEKINSTPKNSKSRGPKKNWQEIWKCALN